MPSFETIVIQFQQKESKILQNSEKVPKKTRKRRFSDTETESGKDKLTKNLRHAAVIAVVFRDIIGTRLYGIGRIFMAAPTAAASIIEISFPDLRQPRCWQAESEEARRVFHGMALGNVFRDMLEIMRAGVEHRNFSFCPRLHGSAVSVHFARSWRSITIILHGSLARCSGRSGSSTTGMWIACV